MTMAKEMDATLSLHSRDCLVFIVSRVGLIHSEGERRTGSRMAWGCVHEIDLG